MKNHSDITAGCKFVIMREGKIISTPPVVPSIGMSIAGISSRKSHKTQQRSLAMIDTIDISKSQFHSAWRSSRSFIIFRWSPESSRMLFSRVAAARSPLRVRWMIEHSTLPSSWNYSKLLSSSASSPRTLGNRYLMMSGLGLSPGNPFLNVVHVLSERFRFPYSQTLGNPLQLPRSSSSMRSLAERFDERSGRTNRTMKQRGIVSCEARRSSRHPREGATALVGRGESIEAGRSSSSLHVVLSLGAKRLLGAPRRLRAELRETERRRDMDSTNIEEHGL